MTKTVAKKNHHWDHFRSCLMSDSQSKFSLLARLLGYFLLKMLQVCFSFWFPYRNQSQSSLAPRSPGSCYGTRWSGRNNLLTMKCLFNQGTFCFHLIEVPVYKIVTWIDSKINHQTGGLKVPVINNNDTVCCDTMIFSLVVIVLRKCPFSHVQWGPTSLFLTDLKSSCRLAMIGCNNEELKIKWDS